MPILEGQTLGAIPGGGRLSFTMLLSLQMGICVGLMQITYKTFVFICTWGMYVCEGDVTKKYEGVFTILHSNFKRYFPGVLCLRIIFLRESLF